MLNFRYFFWFAVSQSEHVLCKTSEVKHGCSGVFDVPGRGPVSIFAHPAAQGQHAWLTKPLALHLFGNDKKSTERLLAMMAHIRDGHASLWPSETPPGIIRLADQSVSHRTAQAQPSALCTSLVFAALVSLFESRIRPVQSRMKAATLLKEFINIMCERLPNGLDLNVALVRPNGTYTFKQQVLTTPLSGILLHPAMLAAIALTWNSEVLSETKPWMTTTVSQPHLADWLCFSLDALPIRARSSTPELHSAKTYLRLSALGVITQLRQIFDQDWINLTRPTQKLIRGIATKRLRMGSVEVWCAISAAFNVLAEGVASWLRKLLSAWAVISVCTWDLIFSDNPK